jgi:hypothetical protein
MPTVSLARDIASVGDVAKALGETTLREKDLETELDALLDRSGALEEMLDLLSRWGPAPPPASFQSALHWRPLFSSLILNEPPKQLQ